VDSMSAPSEEETAETAAYRANVRRVKESSMSDSKKAGKIEELREERRQQVERSSERREQVWKRLTDKLQQTVPKTTKTKKKKESWEPSSLSKLQTMEAQLLSMRKQLDSVNKMLRVAV
jgi:flagellar motor protein MotB